MGGLSDGRQRTPWRAEDAEVLSHERRGPDWYTLELSAPGIARLALPGQFVQVQVTPSDPVLAVADPLLRRPLSLCTIDGRAGRIAVIYRVVGRGTLLLSRLRVGDGLSLLGPLGCSFPDPARPMARTRPLLLVGGGLGIPPLAAAAAWAVRCGRTPLALLGAASAAQLAGAAEVEASGARIQVATEDGSQGARGRVTLLLEAALAHAPQAEVWACGPEAMLAEVRRRASAAGAPCWLCVERPMACGFGVCLGCAIARADGQGYLRACVEGPVVPAQEVALSS
jgi:dihydroorotate dehydrogenase electron transfer subunit